jgi:hypothetical protein
VLQVLACRFGWLGLLLMVVDYRGFGWSDGGEAHFTRLLSDAEPLVR